MSDFQENAPVTNVDSQPTQQDAVLKDLAKQIKVHHGKFQKHCRASLQYAYRAGQVLETAKKLVKGNGGSWRKWLAKNCKLSNRQAQKYMKLASGYLKLLTQGYDLTKLTINQALKLLAGLRCPSPSGEGKSDLPATKGQRPADYYRLSKSELDTKKVEAAWLMASKQIRFEADSAAGKFVRVKVKALAEQIRKQALILGGAHGQTGEVQPIHLAIALIERLAKELNAEVLVEAVKTAAEPAATSFVQDHATLPQAQDSSPSVLETPVPEATPRANAAKRSMNGHRDRNGTPALAV